MIFSSTTQAARNCAGHLWAVETLLVKYVTEKGVWV